MDGQVTTGWYRHPKLGLIKIFVNEKREWVYQCFSESRARALSREKEMDNWTWALCKSAGEAE